MSLSPEKTFHDALKAARPATVRLSPNGERKARWSAGKPAVR